MNTRLNNWFILPDYMVEDGIYCEFNSYTSYKRQIWNMDTYPKVFIIAKILYGFMDTEDTLELENPLNTIGQNCGDRFGRFDDYCERINSYLKQPSVLIEIKNEVEDRSDPEIFCTSGPSIGFIPKFYYNGSGTYPYSGSENGVCSEDD